MMVRELNYDGLNIFFCRIPIDEVSKMYYCIEDPDTTNITIMDLNFKPVWDGYRTEIPEWYKKKIVHNISESQSNIIRKYIDDLGI